MVWGTTQRAAVAPQECGFTTFSLLPHHHSWGPGMDSKPSRLRLRGEFPGGRGEPRRNARVKSESPQSHRRQPGTSAARC